MHVVKSGENLNKIAYGYQLKPIEIQKINKHISNWEKLIPGTKIKLPEISDQVNEEINEVEPFIEDYYPKVELPKVEEEIVIENIESKELIDEEEPVSMEEKKIMTTKKKTTPIYNPYYMYNPYGYNFYYNRYYTPPKKRSR